MRSRAESATGRGSGAVAPAAAAPASGVSTDARSHDRRLMAPRLGSGIAVSALLDVEADHHRVVFVNQVVAMQQVAPREVSKAHEDSRLLSGHQPRDIFP